MAKNITIKNYFGRSVEVSPQLVFYDVNDYMGRKMNIPGIELIQVTDGSEEPFEDRITKSFGEFISLKNCAYIDLNNCPYATELLEQGIAEDTGFTKHSGFCEYPLWHFDEEFLKDIGGEEYEMYSKEFDRYMYGDMDNEEEIEEDMGQDTTQMM